MVARRSSVRTGAIATALLCVVFLVGYTSPTKAAEQGRVEHENIFITGDSQFNPANGVRKGSGTKQDPFVISGWDVGSIHIRDTAAHVVIRDNTITNQLVLNWNGPGVTVVNNDVRDLRVNQNVKRTGDATGGYIAHNKFGIVGQLRHFDGIFEDNLVKPTGMDLGPILSNQAVQFDGFHGSRFRDNTIYGFVDVKLHGHHHGSSFDEGSHYHGAEPEGGEHAAHEGNADHAGMDHTQRFHEVYLTNNRIFAEGDYALRYTDQAHAGDDRTAPSETNPALNDKHVHYTRVHLVGNELKGAGLMVDVFNADDERHTSTQTGLIDIRDNQITLERNSDEYPFTPKDGITVRQAKDAMVHIAQNSVLGEDPQSRDLLDEQFAIDAGILLLDVDMANIHLQDNSVGNMLYGVRAQYMTGKVDWAISGLDTTAVTHSVYWDNTVENAPRREP